MKGEAQSGKGTEVLREKAKKNRRWFKSPYLNHYGTNYVPSRIAM